MSHKKFENRENETFYGNNYTTTNAVSMGVRE